MTAEYDEGNTLEAFGGANLMMLLDSDGQVLLRRTDVTVDAVVSAVDEALACEGS